MKTGPAGGPPPASRTLKIEIDGAPATGGGAFQLVEKAEKTAPFSFERGSAGDGGPLDPLVEHLQQQGVLHPAVQDGHLAHPARMAWIQPRTLAPCLRQ